MEGDVSVAVDVDDGDDVAVAAGVVVDDDAEAGGGVDAGSVEDSGVD